MNPSTIVLRRDVADVQASAETCGQIRPLLEEKDNAAAEVHHLQITNAKLHYHQRTDEIYYVLDGQGRIRLDEDRKSTRLNSSHRTISYAVFCLKKKKT